MKFIYYFLCLIYFAFPAFGDEQTSKKQKICLNMIVKDETKVITRGLATVKPFIDYWVIVDTGSTDGTQEMIKTFMKDIPGELHERPWKNFAHNRNEALDLAKGKADYILFIDADELLEFSPNFKMPPLSKDSYDSIINDMGTQYDRTLLIKDGLDWKWYGVLHEYIASPKASSKERLIGVTKISKREGNRSTDPKKYEKDAQLLEEALISEPSNSRYVFYLAQSYRDARNYAASLKNYQKRASMGGWDEEVFFSLLQAAQMQQILNEKPEIFIKSYYDAYHFRPSRAEPLFALAKYYRDKNDFAAGYLVASIGITLPMPNDVLFVEKTIYDYQMELECSVDAYWIGKYDVCQSLSAKILSKPNIPAHIRKVVEQNLLFANMKLVEQQRDQLQKKEPQIPAQFNQSIKHNNPESAQQTTRKNVPIGKQSDSSNISLKTPIQVAWEGTYMDLTSLSHVNRAITEELSKISNIKLTCVGPNNVNSKLSQIPELQKMAKRLNQKALPETHITVRHAWPPNWIAPAHGKWVLIQPWEYGFVPIEWVENIKRVDEVWAYTDFVKQEYIDSGVPEEKVFIVPCGIDPTIFNPAAKPRKLPTQKKFKFLFLGGTLYRKGPDLLLNSYLKSFNASDDVCLIIKDFGGKAGYAGQTHDSAIKAAQNQPNAPEIIYFDDDLSTEEIASLYTACDCLIHPYRGEGFALPVLEAMACGIPVVVTEGGATDDFVTSETGWFLPAVVKPYGPSVSGMQLVKEGWVLEPNADHLTALLPWLVKNPDKVAAKGLAASEYVKKQWTWRHAAEIAAERLKALSSSQSGSGN